MLKFTILFLIKSENSKFYKKTKLFYTSKNKIVVKFCKNNYLIKLNQ